MRRTSATQLLPLLTSWSELVCSVCGHKGVMAVSMQPGPNGMNERCHCSIACLTKDGGLDWLRAHAEQPKPPRKAKINPA